MTTPLQGPRKKKDQSSEIHKAWKVLDPSLNIVEKLQRELGIHPWLSHLLVNRGIETPEQAQRFLYPNLRDLHDSFLLKNAQKAVDRLIQALMHGERILIFGDDDVDGTTSTSLIYSFLKDLGAKVRFFIPQRALHGHGMNLTAIQAAIESFPSNLVITADCGMTNWEEIDWLAAQGIDTLIVDHHIVPIQLPHAVAILNPQLPQNPFPFKDLAAVGVAYHLVDALYRALDALGIFEHLDAPVLEDYLDLVCFGTVADVVPLKDENRVFVKLGLKIMQRQRRGGLAALLERVHASREKVTERTIGYRLAPRVNAAGRVGNPNQCVELLTTPHYGVAQKLAKRLDEYNTRRQAAEAEILTEATELARLQIEAGRNVLVIAKENWNQGVLGIVASRLLEKFHHPTILLASKDGLAKGSARSPVSVNILQCIQSCAPLLQSFGGHPFAAGLTIKSEDIPDFQVQIERAAQKILGVQGVPAPVMLIDAKIHIRDFHLTVVRELEKLAPFGAGNREPTFLLTHLKVLQMKIIRQRHLKLKLKDREDVFQAIGFSLAHQKVRVGQYIDAVISPRLSKREHDGVEYRILALRFP